MDAVQVLAAVEQMDEQELDVVFDALRARNKAIQAQRGREAMLSLKKGDAVELCDISPKFLAGVKATVESVDKGAVRVKIAEDEFAARDRRGRVIGVHPSCVKKVDA